MRCGRHCCKVLVLVLKYLAKYEYLYLYLLIFWVLVLKYFQKYLTPTLPVLSTVINITVFTPKLKEDQITYWMPNSSLLHRPSEFQSEISSVEYLEKFVTSSEYISPYWKLGSILTPQIWATTGMYSTCYMWCNVHRQYSGPLSRDLSNFSVTSFNTGMRSLKGSNIHGTTSVWTCTQKLKDSTNMQGS